jgi:hypothetical protein
MTKTLVLLLGLCGAGCAAMVGTSGPIYVPKDAATTCSTHCKDIGLALSSVVIMANTVGCVCSAASPASSSGASGGGMAALIMEEEQRKQDSSSSQPVSSSQHH